MVHIFSVLQQNAIFRTKSLLEIESLLNQIRYTSRRFQKHEVIVTEGDPAGMLGFILKGSVEIQKSYSNGHILTIARLQPGQTFGEAVLFTKTSKYPATVMTSEPSEILFIAKAELLKLFAIDSEINALFLENLSERLVLLNQKIEVLSLGSLRQRIAFDLLRERKKQKNDRIALPYSKRIWAEHLNAARPSLSREIGIMRDLGWLSYKGTHFELLNVTELEKLLAK